jgi:copper chaperone CopZ
VIHPECGLDPFLTRRLLPVLRLAFILAIAAATVACGASAASTPTPLALSPTPIPTATRVVPLDTATPVSSPVPVFSPTVPPGLGTEDIQYSGALSVEDLNTLILAIRALKGVQDVQGGVQDLYVTYDRDQVSRQKIVDVIKSFGYTVKE